ncbi:hypothetical protein LguiA_035559 [Lonicera macranthoides]
MIQGSLKDQFSKFHDYIAELKRSNHGTTVKIQGDGLDVNRFLKIYICLAACKKGMIENCRPLVGIDV